MVAPDPAPAPDEPETVVTAGTVETAAIAAAAAATDATVTMTGGVDDGAMMEPARERDVELGTRVGRYLILDVVGRGGMGTVYRAHDPELDRRVAIKVLRGRHAALARDALLGEAQALARLSHPNVVAVYDVGVHDATVFVAMELVEGLALGRWLRQPRELREILDVVIAAGRGIAAAHHVGLVHRDVKPGNILIGQDGRVRVADFGLARVHTALPRDDAAPGSVDTGPVSDDSKLSATGDVDAIAGTPGYMAPEQFRGAAIDARCDQFAFCATLFRAVYGKTPFVGATLDDVKLATLSDAPVAVEDERAPAWLRRVIRRGMATEPAQRFASMDALLVELERDRRRPLRWAAVGACLVATAAVAALIAHDDPARACPPLAARGASLWNERIADALDRRLAPAAGDELGRLHAAATTWSAAWAASADTSCRATYVARTQEAQLHALRMRCLDRRAGALHGQLAALDGVEPARALEAILALPGAELCASDDDLLATRPPPAGAAQRAQVAEVERRIDGVRGLAGAGRYREAVLVGRAVRVVATVTGHAPTELDAMLALAEALGSEGGDAEQARLIDAVIDRAATAPDDDAIARAWAMAIANRTRGGRLEEAARLERVARIAVARAGDTPARRIDMLAALFSMHFDAGHLDEAAGVGAEELALHQQRTRPGDPAVLQARSKLANIAFRRGDYALATHEYRAVVDGMLAIFGPEHPRTGTAYHNLAIALYVDGQPAPALELAAHSLAIDERTLRPDSMGLAHGHLTLAQMIGESHGDPAAERRHLERAIENFERAGGAPPLLGVALSLQGGIVLRSGDLDGALAIAARARRATLAAVGDAHPWLGYPLVIEGEVALKRGDAATAVRLLDEASRRLDSPDIDRTGRAEADLSYADACWRLPACRPGARARAERARAVYAEGGSRDAADRAEAEAWLASHPATAPNR